MHELYLVHLFSIFVLRLVFDHDMYHQKKIKRKGLFSTINKLEGLKKKKKIYISISIEVMLLYT